MIYKKPVPAVSVLYCKRTFLCPFVTWTIFWNAAILYVYDSPIVGLGPPPWQISHF